MDANLSHPPVFVEELWKRRGDPEILTASRHVEGGKAEMRPSRRMLAWRERERAARHVRMSRFGEIANWPRA
ncbi:MAG: hypothetical protein ACR2NN_01455 [Bryobacteraceae bacterium]